MPRSQNRSTSRPDAREFRVRPATLRDVPLLVDHRRWMWEDIVRARKDHRNVPYTASDIGRADPAYRAWVRGEMRSKRFVAFVAEGPKGPLGSGSLWLQPSEPRPGRLAGGVLPQVISMYTAPRFRGRGIATGLVEAQLAWLRASGFDGRVGLHASDAGRPVYERIGFRAGTEMVIDLWARPRRARAH